ncbi:MAG: ATP synthase F1 subunit epsilon [Evtepia sp.]
MNFHLKIAASDRAFYDGDCESLILSTAKGEYGVLANHEAMVVAIEAGEIRYKTEKGWASAVTGIGFASIHDNAVIVVIDTVELPEEIDYNRAMLVKQQAQESMQQKKSQIEYYQGQLALARAMARINMKNKDKDKLNRL